MAASAMASLPFNNFLVMGFSDPHSLSATLWGLACARQWGKSRSRGGQRSSRCNLAINRDHRIRADYRAHRAASAVQIWIDQLCGMITFGVEGIRHADHILRAHAYTQFTALTMFGIDFDAAPGSHSASCVWMLEVGS